VNGIDSSAVEALIPPQSPILHPPVRVEPRPHLNLNRFLNRESENRMPPFHSSLRVESFFLCVIMGTTNNNNATIKKPRDIGREIKIENSPRDIISDCRREVSSSPPSTKARTMGAPS
jgi:hypothetical protein